MQSNFENDGNFTKRFEEEMKEPSSQITPVLQWPVSIPDADIKIFIGANWVEKDAVEEIIEIFDLCSGIKTENKRKGGEASPR